MVDIVLVAATHVAGIDQVEDPEYNAGDGKYHIEIDLLQRSEEDIGEYHGRYGSRCSHGTVLLIIPVPDNGGDGRECDGGEIEQDIEKGSGKYDTLLFKAAEDLLNPRPKGIEYQHIDSQVHIVGMQECMGDDPVILAFVHDLVWGQVEPVE